MADLKWHKIETTLPDGEFVKMVVVDGKKLCLLRNDGKLYLVQNSCPHAGGVLSGGWCVEGHLVCPIHRYEYDLTTGRGAEGQGDYIRIYPLREEVDGLYAGIKRNLFQRFFSK